MTVSKELRDKLLDIYFRESYAGFGANSQEDLDFIKYNTFKVIVTKDTVNNGYEFDSEKAQNLGINIPYTIKDMWVGRSSSTLELVEFPGVHFNTVNFEFLEL